MTDGDRSRIAALQYKGCGYKRIAAKEYAKIDIIIAEKYGISSCNIFR